MAVDAMGATRPAAERRLASPHVGAGQFTIQLVGLRDFEAELAKHLMPIAAS